MWYTPDPWSGGARHHPPYRRCKARRRNRKQFVPRWSRGNEAGGWCAAAVPAAAETLKLFLHFRSLRLIDLQTIVIRQLLAGTQISQSVNKDAGFFFDRFTIRIARMIDPASFVAADGSIDHIIGI